MARSRRPLHARVPKGLAGGGRHELSVSRGVGASIEVVGSEVAVALAD